MCQRLWTRAGSSPRPGAVGTGQGEAIGHFDAVGAGLEGPALDTQLREVTVDVGVAIPLGAGENDGKLVALLSATGVLLEGLSAAGNRVISSPSEGVRRIVKFRQTS